MDGITPYTVTLTQEGCPPGTGDDAPGDVGDDSFIIPASGNNYICTTTFTSQDGVRSYSAVTYYDGLGYAVQENMIGAGGTGKSIITPIVYDNMRRADAVAYLPYAASSVTGSFIQTSSAISAQATFFRNTFGDNHAYAVNEYEPWTGGKLISSRKPGDAWVNGDHRSSYNRRSNTSSDAVRKITQSLGSNSTVTTSGYHTAGSLIVDILTDEEGDETIVFTDASGKKICTRQHDGHDSADTYYVYDIRDNLVCVIQPEGAASLSSSSTISFTSDIAQKWFFTWKYDAWGNVTEYHVPGGGTTTYAYDSRNRLISEKTPKLADIGATRVITYDDCDRPTAEKYRRDSDGRVVQTHSWTYYPFGSSAPAGSRGLLQSETVWEIPQSVAVNQSSLAYCTRNYSYDSEGRVTGISESWSDGWTSNVSTTYDFVGNVTSVIESHSGPGGYSQTISTSYTYDQRGRKLTSSRSVSGTDTGNMTLATVTYSYDELGRPSGKTVTGSNGSTLVYEDFDLDIHGWTNSIIAKDNVNRTFFRENLAYTNPPTPISVARYDGNISESSYFHFSYPDDTPAILNSFYSYSYDGMKRLVDAKHSNVSVFDNDLDTERHITYDRNGNITHLLRLGSNGEEFPLTFSYSGNQMTSVNGFSYSYDSAGNMTHDGSKGLDISNNCLNLPSNAETADGSSLTYTYLPDGTKMLVTNSGRGLRYIGSFTFSVAGANNFALESIACDEGRFALVSGGTSSPASLKDLFFVTDHLGNVRSIADVSPGLTAPVILEQNDYLPFGTKVQNPSYAKVDDNRYRYANKEEQSIGGANLSLLDFGARYYDPYIARWTSVDPMASDYSIYSPYNYCSLNPINKIDLYGKAAGDYYTYSGNYITSDNINDKKIYLTSDTAASNYYDSKSISDLRANSEEVDGIVFVYRTNNSNEATTGRFVAIGQNGFMGYTLERGGTPSTESGKCLPIPNGVYDTSERQEGKISNHFAFRIFNSEVPIQRGILGHIGNTTGNSKGCILFGTTENFSVNRVENSGTAMDKFETYFTNKDNIKLITLKCY